MKHPGQRTFVGDDQLGAGGIANGGAQGHDTSETVAEEDNGTVLRFALGNGEEIPDVVFQRQWLKVARALVAAPVVGDEVERLSSASEAGERAAAIKPPVDADNGGEGIPHAPLGEGQSGDGRV